MARTLWVMVDVETTGPVPGLFSMTEIGAIVVEPRLTRIFYGQLRPLPDAGFDPYVMTLPRAIETQSVWNTWGNPGDVMRRFEEWCRDLGASRLIGVSDNNGFDFAFVNWYFYRFLTQSPFGHSSQNLGSIYKGAIGDAYQNFKHLRVTPHTHHPVDDARGNAEAMLQIARHFEIRGMPGV